MSLQKIKVSKTELLGIVKDNKKKHDEIYEAAEAGYWLEAEDFLKKHQKDMLSTLKKNYKSQVKALRKQVATELKMVEEKKKTGYLYMKKPFPENHTDDYEGTIKRLELSIDDKIELENNEFDCYVRNKWEWRQSFLNTNSYYANNYAVSSSYALTSSWASNVATWTTGSLCNSLNTF